MKRILLSLVSLALFFSVTTSQNIIKPSEFFGFIPGSDRNLFDYEHLISYMMELDKVSDRMEIREIGLSPEERKMYLVFISNSENIKNLDRLKDVNKKLALDPDLDETERTDIINTTPVFIMSTLSMHSNEVGPSQSLPLIAYELCTTTDSDKLNWLSSTVLMIVPCHNPDGMNMIVNYYNETKGGKYEGSSMPGVYHKYVGHDNNRDFVILSQSDTKAVAKVYNQDWFPQVFVEKHQMGATGTRYFVPPNHDPIAENIDEGIWNWTGIFGANLIRDMTYEGQAGISQHYLFDDYWPGSTETCIWKNVIGFLTECASAKVATPIYIEPTELQVIGKGLAEYKKSINMPLPWNGGWWKLCDIVDYEVESTWSIMKTSYNHRRDILKYRNDLCRTQVDLGKTKAPYYYVMPSAQHDGSELVFIVNLLLEHGIRVYEMDRDMQTNILNLKKGDIVVPMAQPFRPFIKEVMEKQKFPVRRYMPEGEIIKPYDITSWSLPLHNGVLCHELNSKIENIEAGLTEINSYYKSVENNKTGKFMIFSASENESYKAAFLAVQRKLKNSRTTESMVIDGKKIPKGSFVIQSSGIEENNKFLSELSVFPVFTDTEPSMQKYDVPEIALVESYFHDMDAGWTRFVLDEYHIPFTVLRPGEFVTTDFSKYDVIIFPDENSSVLMEGKTKNGDSYSISSYAPEFTKGITKEGMQKLVNWIDEGGIVISWGESTNLFEGALIIEKGKGEKEEFQFAFKDVSKDLEKKGLYCPGSLIKMKLTIDHPLTIGMPEETGIFYRGKPTFSTSIPNFDTDRRVIGTIPEEDILMSGYIEKSELIANKPVMLWLQKGKGQLVLMGFSPQFRASTHATYKLLFNSILLHKIS